MPAVGAAVELEIGTAERKQALRIARIDRQRGGAGDRLQVFVGAGRLVAADQEPASPRRAEVAGHAAAHVDRAVRGGNGVELDGVLRATDVAVVVGEMQILPVAAMVERREKARCGVEVVGAPTDQVRVAVHAAIGRQQGVRQRLLEAVGESFPRDTFIA